MGIEGGKVALFW